MWKIKSINNDAFLKKRGAESPGGAPQTLDKA
jgi:hypothetical protein